LQEGYSLLETSGKQVEMRPYPWRRPDPGKTLQKSLGLIEEDYFFFAGAFFASGFLTSGFFATAMDYPPPTGKD